MSKATAGGERAGDDVLEAAREAARRDGLTFAEWMGRRLAEHGSQTDGSRRPLQKLPQYGAFKEPLGGRETDAGRAGAAAQVGKDGRRDSPGALSATLGALERRLRDDGEDPVIRKALSDIESRLRTFAENRTSRYLGPDAVGAKNPFPDIRNAGAAMAPPAESRLAAMHDRIAQFAGKLDEMCRGVEDELARAREAARFEEGGSIEPVPVGSNEAGQQDHAQVFEAGAMSDRSHEFMRSESGLEPGFPAPEGDAAAPGSVGASESPRAQNIDPSDDALKRIEARLEALADRADETLRSAFESHRVAMAEHFEGARRRNAEQIDEGAATAAREAGELKTLVASLVERQDAEPGAPATRLAIEAVARDLAEIRDRLDRADENFAALRSLEPAIAAMAGRIEETRRLAAEAAEAANRAASQDHLSGAAARELEQRLTREIADLRVFQDASDRRAHLSASAAQETVGQFADRLAKLETFLGEARTGQGPFGSLPAPTLAPAPSRDQIDAIWISDQTAAGGSDQTPGSGPKSGLGETEEILIEPGGGFPRGRQKREAAPLDGAPDPLAKTDPSGDPGRTDVIAAALSTAEAAGLDGAAQTTPKNARAAHATAQTVERILHGGGLFGARKHPMILGAVAAMLGLGAYVSATGAGRSFDGLTPAVIETFMKKLLSAGTPHDDESPVVAQEPPQSPGESAPRSNAFDARLFDPRPLGRLDIEPWRLSAAQKAALAPGGEAAPAAGAGGDQTPTDAIEGADGDAAADFQRGVSIAENPLGPHDMKRAAHWYEKAARKGSALAQYRLGTLFEKGSGVARDAAQAKALYLAAAEQGNTRAMHNLGVLAAEGVNGKPDYANAVIWFAKAARYGVRDSQFNIAVLLARGLGAPQDSARAYMWFSLLAAQGDAEADRRAQDLAARLTGAELAEARAAAAAFRPQTADGAANEAAASQNGDGGAGPARKVKPQVSGL